MQPAPSETPGQRPDVTGDEVDLRALLQVLLRRRWLAAAAVGAALIIGVLATLRAPRVYRSTATVLIDRNAPDVLSGVREVYDLGASDYWSTKEYHETQQNVIKSRPVLEKTAMRLGLAPSSLAEQVRAAPAATLEDQAAAEPLAGLPKELRRKLKLVGVTGGERDDVLEALEDMDVAAALKAKLSVAPVKDSHLVTVSVEDTDPDTAALVANNIADAYIEYNLSQKIAMTGSAVDWLSDQMTELKQKLTDSEQALQDFKKANNIVSASMEDRQSMISETLSQRNRSVSEARNKRQELESRRERISRAQAAGDAGDALTEVIQNSLIQKLKATRSDLRQTEKEMVRRYTAEHPKLGEVRDKLALVEQELKLETDKIMRAVEEDYQAALGNERRATEALEEAKVEAHDLNQKQIEYNRLKRERDNNATLYEMVLKREKEAQLSQLLKVNNVRKLEAAVAPDFPVRPRVKLNLLVALMLGLVGGVGLAFLVDYLDNTIKTQAQVEQTLALPFLGIVPAIKGDKSASLVEVSDRDHFIIAHPRSSVAECCRTIRTNLLFMSPERPLKTLVVTSSGPREGKSTTVVNTAVTMAQSGSRVVIVDTDMRRPRLHKSFGLDNDVGVSSLLLGGADLDSAVRPTGVDRLDLLSCGPIPPNPAELLHTDRFAGLIRELAERYDRVVLDSPPVAAVADGLILGTMVDGVVLVIEAGKTTWQSALNSKRRLEDVGARLLGVVLNNVDLDNKRSSDYYQYYYYYRSGYGEEPERKRRPRERKAAG